jgi:hypothetical protein
VGWRKKGSLSSIATDYSDTITTNGVVYLFLRDQNTVIPFDLESEEWKKEIKGPPIPNKSRDTASRSSSTSRSVHQLCVIITEAAKEENNHAGNKEVDMQVDKIRSNSKKEKEKAHVSAGEWRMIMTAVNHGTDVPADSRREVLMGYQYALHQRRKKLRQERYMIMRNPDYNSTPSEEY